MTSLALVLPLHTISTLNAREHWSRRARRASEQRGVTRMALAAERAWPLRLPVDVTIIRIAPRSLDGDNLQGACKAVRDGIADALGLDDRDARIRWSYEQRKGVAKQYAVELRIVEATSPTASDGGQAA